MQSLLFLVLACLGSASAFFFTNIKVDCQVSQWSSWAGPGGFGEYERSRTILAYPANGGKSCPNVTETKSAGRQLTVKETATLFTANFLRRTAVATRPKRDPQHTRDLLILMDSSGSIGSGSFTQALKDIAELLGLLCPSDPFQSKEIQYHQAALIQFSDKPKEEFSFGQKFPTSVLKNAIINIKYMDSSTCTGDAFKAALNMFRSSNKGVRNSADVDKEVLIITDGQSNCGYNAIQAASELKAATFSPIGDKVQIYGLIIGISSSTGQDEVKQYVSQPINNHLFSIPGFNTLTGLLTEVKKIVTGVSPCTPIEFKSG